MLLVSQYNLQAETPNYPSLGERKYSVVLEEKE
jgi:hypothetical protein